MMVRRTGVVAPQRNASKAGLRHPLTSRKGTRANVRACIDKAPAVGILGGTEMWSPLLRFAWRNELKADSDKWRSYGGFLNSTFVSWRGDLWTVVKRIDRFGHGLVPRVSDPRRITGVLLRNVDDPNMLVLVLVVHPCPIPTAKAPDQIPEARAAQKKYWANVERLIAENPNALVWIMGDTNDPGRPLGDVVEGRPAGGRKCQYHYSNETNIVQHIFINGRLYKWNVAFVNSFGQPYSDHDACKCIVDIEKRKAPAWAA